MSEATARPEPEELPTPDTEGTIEEREAAKPESVSPESAGPESAAPESSVPTTAPESNAPETAESSVPRAKAAEVEHAGKKPTFLFFGVVASLSLVADVASKSWAAVALGGPALRGLDGTKTLITEHLFLTWALNKGGAWGLLQGQDEAVRKPFFLAVSVLAIAFIVSLYSRLAPGQRALKWGLPLVLGGALGNLADRIVRGEVIDFIDYRADWIASMNRFIRENLSNTWSVTDHWPTFNVADISICIGVALMAVDMLTSRREPKGSEPEKKAKAKAETETAAAS